MAEDTPLELSVGPGLAELERARLAVLHHVRAVQQAPPPALLFAVELVLEEWLTNVFRHTQGLPALASVQLACSSTMGCVELSFEDDGAAFDPTLLADPKPPTSLDEARPGGLGLLLMRRYASAIRYERAGARNRLWVRVGSKGDSERVCEPGAPASFAAAPAARSPIPASRPET